MTAEKGRNIISRLPGGVSDHPHVEVSHRMDP